MGNIAIIPARGGSKRIPRKNIKDFLGKPIIAYSIEAAIASNLFDEIMVSTDDIEIAEIAIKYGAKVPFMRSQINSDDYAGTAEVLLEVIEAYSKKNMLFEYVCCIYPTAPLISVNSIIDGFDLLIVNKYNSVFPVCAFGYPILRGLERDGSGKTKMIWPEHLSKRSQDLAPAYHDAGQFYWVGADSLLSEKKLFTSNSATIVLDQSVVQDIDNETDWKMAGLKYNLLYTNEG